MIARFDDFQLDTEARALTRSGQTVALQPKAFDLLAFLIENRERVLTRDDLFAAIWRGEIVSDSALSFSVKAIRHALGDIGRPRRYIETAHSRGFRFIAACRVDGVGSTLALSTAAPLPQPALAPSSSVPSGQAAPFVGREVERGALGSHRREALAGHGRICFVGGDPGIGKSRLASETLADAAAAGFQILYGRCHDAAAPSLWPWVQIIGAYVAATTPDIARRVLGTSTVDLARLIPALQTLDATLPTLPDLDPEQGRLRLFDSVIEFLLRAANERPLALCLEDLHWADAASILVLRQAVAQFAHGSIFVIGTFRPEEIDTHHPFAAALASMQRQGHVDLIRLNGLAEKHAAQLLHSICGDLPERVADTLVRRAEGHPFYLEELGRAYQEQADDPHDEDVAADLPDTVRATILQRLSRLPENCRQVLALAAVVGRDFDFDILKCASEFADGDLVEALDRVVAANLVTEIAPGRFRFGHALIREGLYNGQSGLRRADLHRRVAEAMSLQPGSDPTAVAFHFTEAIPVLGWQTAYERLIRAGDEATTKLAFEDAVGAFERAFALRPLDDPPPPTEHIRVQLALGRARRNLGDTAAAREAFASAISLARAYGLDELFAEAALSLRSTWALHDEISAEIVAAALERLPRCDSPQRARLLAQLGAALYLNRAETERRHELLGEAAAMARRLDDPRTLFEVLNDSHWAMWSPDNVDARLAVATEQLSIAQRLGDIERIQIASMWRLVDLLEAGQLRRFDAEIGAFTMLAEQHRWPRFRWNALCFRAMRAFLDGSLAEASDLAAQAFEIGQRVEQRTALLTYWGAHLWHIRAEQGRLHEFAEQIVLLGESLTGIVDPGWIAIVQLSVAIEQDDVDTARRMIAEIARDDFAGLPAADSINARVQALALMANATTALDVQEHAPRLYAMLQPYEEQWVVVAFGAVCFGSVSLPLGRLATTLRRWAAAERHLERALHIHTQEGARLPRLWTQIELARLRLAARKRVKASDAMSLLDEVAKEAKAIGHTFLQATAENLRASG